MVVMMIPIVWIEKLKHQEIKWFAQCLRTNKRWSQGFPVRLWYLPERSVQPKTSAFNWRGPHDSWIIYGLSVPSPVHHCGQNCVFVSKWAWSWSPADTVWILALHFNTCIHLDFKELFLHLWNGDNDDLIGSTWRLKWIGHEISHHILSASPPPTRVQGCTKMFWGHVLWA